MNDKILFAQFSANRNDKKNRTTFFKLTKRAFKKLILRSNAKDEYIEFVEYLKYQHSYNNEVERYNNTNLIKEKDSDT